jgi:hypothetical protein
VKDEKERLRRLELGNNDDDNLKNRNKEHEIILYTPEEIE